MGELDGLSFAEVFLPVFLGFQEGGEDLVRGGGEKGLVIGIHGFAVLGYRAMAVFQRFIQVGLYGFLVVDGDGRGCGVCTMMHGRRFMTRVDCGVGVVISGCAVFGHVGNIS